MLTIHWSIALGLLLGVCNAGIAAGIWPALTTAQKKGALICSGLLLGIPIWIRLVWHMTAPRR